MRLVLGWLIASIALIVCGGQMAHDAASNGSAPLAVSVAELGQAKPEKTWLKVTDGVLILPLVTWMEDKATKRIDEVFIPIVPASAQVGDIKNVQVLLRTRRPEFIARVREIRALDKGTDAQAEKYIVDNMEKLFVKQDVQGMVEWGIASSSETRDAISNLTKRLAPNFMILRDGKQPEGSAGMAMLVGGVVLLLGGGAFLFGGKIPRPGGKREASRARREPIVPERVAPEEPRMIEVGSDFARELGLEKAPPVSPKAKTKKVTKHAVAEQEDAAPVGVAVKAAPKKPAVKAPAVKAKAKPLLARKKRTLGG
ncbi:MAG: hypothetical protein ACAI25_12775 [Planctomycetota bacterium]